MQYVLHINNVFTVMLQLIYILVNCPPGSQGVTGSTCTLCTTDTFQDQQGQVTCRPCPDGQGTNLNGSVECTGKTIVKQPCGCVVV